MTCQGDILVPKRGQHADIGYIAETVRIRRLFDEALLDNPSSRKACEDAAGLPDENGAVARGLGKHPGKISVGGLLAGQAGIVEAALYIVKFGDRSQKINLVCSLSKPDADRT